MDENSRLKQLEEVARALGITVRYEPIRKESSFYPGGLCRLRGETVLIINSQATMDDKIQTVAEALRHFDLSQVFMRPALREFLTKPKDSGSERS